MTEHDISTHDLVDVEVGDETYTGVVRTEEPNCYNIKLRRGAVSEEYETDDVWAFGDTAYVTEEFISNVRKVDTDNLHPQNFGVDAHEREL